MSIPAFGAAPQYLPRRGMTLRKSASVAVLAIAFCGAIAMFAVMHFQDSVLNSQRKLAGVQDSLALKKTEHAQSVSLSAVPVARASVSNEEITRDLVRFAQSNGVHIKSIRVQPQANSDQKAGLVLYEINAAADYSSAKLWIAALLARYASMAVSSMSMRRPSSDLNTLEATVTLTVFANNVFGTARAALEPPRKDSFAFLIPAVIPVKASPVVIPAPPPAPVAPSLNMSFAGRMTDLNGVTKVFVLLDKTSMAIEPGQTLPNGYLVDAVTDQSIELTYPPLKTKARFDLPNAPKQEIR